MLVFIYGADSYRLKQAKEDIISRYKARYSSGINSFAFDLSNSVDMSSFENSLKTSSFFNEHKLVVCAGVFNKKQSADNFLKISKENGVAAATDITLVVIENLQEKDLVAKNKDLFKFLSSKDSIVKTVEPLNGSRLSEWVKNEFETRNCSIKESSLKKLIEIAGNDSWALMSEIEKLTAFKAGGEVTAGDITLLVSFKTDPNIFDLIDALGSKNNKKALELLYRELKSGRDPYYILTMIIYQFRNLVTVKDLQKQGYSKTEISTKSRLHPFVVTKAIRSNDLFTNEELVKIYGQLLTIDTSFKAGTVNLEDSLYKLAV